MVKPRWVGEKTASNARESKQGQSSGARKRYCASADTSRSRHQDRIKPARHLLEEMHVQVKGRGRTREQIAMLV